MAPPLRGRNVSFKTYVLTSTLHCDANMQHINQQLVIIAAPWDCFKSVITIRMTEEGQFYLLRFHSVYNLFCGRYCVIQVNSTTLDSTYSPWFLVKDKSSVRVQTNVSTQF